MVNNFAPWPHYSDEEKNAVLAVLESGKVNYWTGVKCQEFENAYAAYLGRKHALSLFNGTVALELALYAYDIGPGDEVIVTSRTFIASASCVVARGAKPVVVEIDRDSQNMDVESIREHITKKTKAIICVHLAGWPCDMDAICSLAKKHNLIVIEDCAQAHGAKYKGKPVGAFGDMAAFSFCQDKIITTGGEGGLLVCDDDERFKKCWAYKDHGKNYDLMHDGSQYAGFKWVHDSFGTNWRMTEIQAVLGLIQLKRLDEDVKRRRENASKLIDAFKEIETLRVAVPASDIYHAYYKFYVFVRPEKLKSGRTRDNILQEINARGVPCFTGSCSEIYREKAFVSAGYSREKPFANARELGETSLMFLVHPTLTSENLAKTISVVRELL